MIEECLAVEVRVEGDGCPLAEASLDAGARIDARPPQLRYDGYALLRFSAADGDRLTDVLDADDRIRYLHVTQADGRYDFRCLSKRPCVIHELISAGFMVEEARYRAGTATLTGAVVGHEVLRGVMDTAGEAVGVRLERAHPLGRDGDAPMAHRWDITPRQERALEAALEMGYFSVPRNATASDVASALGISKSAFLERLRRGQESLFDELLYPADP